MNIHELSPVVGSTHVGKRKGRGHATGNGKTAGRGHKVRRPAAAAASASASKAARCLWRAASRSAVSTTSSPNRSRA